MKKLLIALVVGLTALGGMQNAFADDSANIRIHITGAARDNTYFLCLPNVGCLSILAGDKGKTYPVFNAIAMDRIFVTDADHQFRLSNEGLPSSCNVTVQPNHTITISGAIAPTNNGTVKINNLHCTVS